MVTIRDSFADPSVVSNDGRSFPLSDSREGASSGTRRRVDVSARPPTATESRACTIPRRYHGFTVFLRVRARRVDDHGDGGGRRPRTGKERKSPARAREPGIERAMGVARRTPAPRPPLCVDRVRLPINIRSSSRVNRFESSHRGVAVESTNSPRVPLNSFSSPSPLDARALGTRRLTAGLGARRFRTLTRCTNCTIRAR